VEEDRVAAGAEEVEVTAVVMAAEDEEAGAVGLVVDGEEAAAALEAGVEAEAEVMEDVVAVEEAVPAVDVEVAVGEAAAVEAVVVEAVVVEVIVSHSTPGLNPLLTVQYSSRNDVGDCRERPCCCCGHH
jgi:hypothetical protein